MNGDLYLGVDPGLTGAMALVDASGAFHSVEDIPVMARGKGRVKHEVDPAGLARLLRPHAASIKLAVVEQVSSMPGQGVASVFSMGHSLGCIVGVLQALGVPLRLVPASVWKRKAGVSADKNLARSEAIRLWPGAPLDRVKDHNRAEALLLARHGLRWQHVDGTR
jgi:crossover junction endodeoxyribonuclease RuvC